MGGAYRERPLREHDGERLQMLRTDLELDDRLVSARSHEPLSP